MTSCKPPPTCIDASPIPDANDSRMSAIPYEANLTPMESPPLPGDASRRSSGCRLGPASWPVRSFGARHAPMRRADSDLAAGDRHEAPLDLTEKLWRQLSVIAAICVHGPQIRPRPREPVAFRQDDPGALVVELQADFHRGRNLDCVGRIGRRR